MKTFEELTHLIYSSLSDRSITSDIGILKIENDLEVKLSDNIKDRCKRYKQSGNGLDFLVEQISKYITPKTSIEINAFFEHLHNLYINTESEKLIKDFRIRNYESNLYNTIGKTEILDLKLASITNTHFNWELDKTFSQFKIQFPTTHRPLFFSLWYYLYPGNIEHFNYSFFIPSEEVEVDLATGPFNKHSFNVSYKPTGDFVHMDAIINYSLKYRIQYTDNWLSIEQFQNKLTEIYE